VLDDPGKYNSGTEDVLDAIFVIVGLFEVGFFFATLVVVPVGLLDSFPPNDGIENLGALLVAGDFETTGVTGDFFPPNDCTENLGALFDFTAGGFLFETTGVAGDFFPPIDGREKAPLDLFFAGVTTGLLEDPFFPPNDGTENLGASKDAFLTAGGFTATAFLLPNDGNENLEDAATGASFLVLDTTVRVFVALICVVEKFTLLLGRIAGLNA